MVNPSGKGIDIQAARSIEWVILHLAIWEGDIDGLANRRGEQTVFRGDVHGIQQKGNIPGVIWLYIKTLLGGVNHIRAIDGDAVH